LLTHTALALAEDDRLPRVSSANFPPARRPFAAAARGSPPVDRRRRDARDAHGERALLARELGLHARGVDRAARGAADGERDGEALVAARVEVQCGGADLDRVGGRRRSTVPRSVVKR
jgi:hypothetical protein